MFLKLEILNLDSEIRYKKERKLRNKTKTNWWKGLIRISSEIKFGRTDSTMLDYQPGEKKKKSHTMIWWGRWGGEHPKWKEISGQDFTSLLPLHQGDHGGWRFNFFSTWRRGAARHHGNGRNHSEGGATLPQLFLLGISLLLWLYRLAQ